MHDAGITVNRNAVPFDPRPPMISSGVRIGTPALAARGFARDEFMEVADIIARRCTRQPTKPHWMPCATARRRWHPPVPSTRC